MIFEVSIKRSYQITLDVIEGGYVVSIMLDNQKEKQFKLNKYCTGDVELLKEVVNGVIYRKIILKGLALKFVQELYKQEFLKLVVDVEPLQYAKFDIIYNQFQELKQKIKKVSSKRLIEGDYEVIEQIEDDLNIKGFGKHSKKVDFIADIRAMKKAAAQRRG